MSTRRSFRDAVADYFRRHEGEWLNATSFEAVGGRMAWRSRISDCRTGLGMEIENRTRRVQQDNGQTYVVPDGRSYTTCPRSHYSPGCRTR